MDKKLEELEKELAEYEAEYEAIYTKISKQSKAQSSKARMEKSKARKERNSKIFKLGLSFVSLMGDEILEDNSEKRQILLENAKLLQD